MISEMAFLRSLSRCSSTLCLPGKRATNLLGSRQLFTDSFPFGKSQLISKCSQLSPSSVCQNEPLLRRCSKFRQMATVAKRDRFCQMAAVSKEEGSIRSRREMMANSTRRTLSTSSDDSSSKQTTERENILTIPNLLCLSRIAISPYLAHLIIHTGNYPWALAVFGYAGVTDAVS